MPFEIEYLDEETVLIIGRGLVVAEELLHVNDRIYSGHTGRNVAFQLVDFSEIVGFEASSDDVRSFAEQDIKGSKELSKQHIAVVGKHDVVYGLARMWETLVDEANITARIFRTREEADDWVAEMKIQRTSL